MKNTNIEKRLYTFPHFILSSLAKGIQTTHSTVEIFNKYVPNPGNDWGVAVKSDDPEQDPCEILWDWSLNYKTEIMLNPGVSGDLEELNYFLQDPENFYPWATFEEDEYSLKGVMTAISIVLPEKIYTTSALLRSRRITYDNISQGYTLIPNCVEIGYSTEEIENIKLVQSYGRFSQFELELVQRLGLYRLAN